MIEEILTVYWNTVRELVRIGVFPIKKSSEDISS